MNKYRQWTLRGCNIIYVHPRFSTNVNFVLRVALDEKHREGRRDGKYSYLKKY